jgi:hypothetical protein
LKRPFHANGFGSCHAFMIRSWASWYLSRSELGFWPYAKHVSIGVPTGKPAISRPPEMQSSIANSSATRIGGS